MMWNLNVAIVLFVWDGVLDLIRLAFPIFFVEVANV